MHAPSAALLGLLLVSLACTPRPATADPIHPGRIVEKLQQLETFGRVLYVAAHPDDENTRLLAYLAKGRGYQTGYLSLTRGDGGQNLIGPELREQLGLIRTHELLAARRIDGAIQFFTRANDFGFSKSPDETLRMWDRRQVLADMVRVLRTFRPHVLITRFSTTPGITHGHHTASTLLALEAFDLAADPTAFPEQIQHGLSPWQAKRIFWNSWPATFRRDGVDPGGDDVLQIDVGGYTPLEGESFSEIAARSRTMHKSQGFGAVGTRGPAPEYFQRLKGEPASSDLLDGVDVSWSAHPGGERVAQLIRRAIERFQITAPENSVPGLLELRRELNALEPTPDLIVKRNVLDEAIVACLGLHILSEIPQADVAPGARLAVKHTLIQRTGPLITWRGTRAQGAGDAELSIDQALTLNRPVTVEQTLNLSPDTPLSHPYWLREPGTPGMFRVDREDLLTLPVAPPELLFHHRLSVGGEDILVRSDAVHVIDDPVRGEIRQAMTVAAPVSLEFGTPMETFTPGQTRVVTVSVIAAQDPAQGELSLRAPPEWTVRPTKSNLEVPARQRRAVSFEVTAPAASGGGVIGATWTMDGNVYRHRRIDLRHEHLPRLTLHPESALTVASFPVEMTARRIGYLTGAGDSVAEALARMGAQVDFLSEADLTTDRLKAFDAVVLGIRALNTRAGIDSHLPTLWEYAEQGGTLVLQYTTPQELKVSRLAPFELRLSRDRVTDETAPVTFLAEDHPAVLRPNRLSSADFDDWVQERGLYFADRWGPEFTPLFGLQDAGEPRREGALLVARHGQGYLVYTGLSFFRQVPEGVAGAYRLLANLVSLGTLDPPPANRKP